MDPLYIQNLRYKLQKRVRRLNSVQGGLFTPALKQFWVFFDAVPTFYGVHQQLNAEVPDFLETVDRIQSGEGLVAETEEEGAAIGGEILRRLSNESDHNLIYTIAQLFGPMSKLNEAVETIREVFLEPFYEYVDEHLDDQRAMLSLLFRYKHRSEWFERGRLSELVRSDTRNAERNLALDLYSYLYDQGIDFTIEPSSLTGEVDLISAQGTDDPLLLDAKIFDGSSRSKSYIRKAFSQIYRYTQQYNEAAGYLLVFKTSEKELQLSLAMADATVPVVVFNHKTIFFIVTDIYEYPRPVSQRDPISAIEISEEEFVRSARSSRKRP